MSPTTTPVRTLDDIAGDDGIFAIIAMDQRNTLRRMFTAVGIDATDAGRVRQPRLLRAPFFTAGTPYVYGSEGWRPAQGGPSPSPVG